MNNNKINKKLEKLTPEQERYMYQFSDDWIDFILNNDGNKNNNNESFLDTYNKIKDDIWWRYEKANPITNKKPLILIADSYLEEKLMFNFVKLFFKDIVGSQVWDQVSDQVWTQVSSQVESQIWAQVRDQVRDQVGAQVRDQVWAQVEDQVRSQVSAQVSDQVWSQVWSQVRSQVSAQVSDQVSDQVSAQVSDQVSDQVGRQKLEFIEQGFGLGYEYWLSFYSYFEKIGGGEIIKGKQKTEFDRYIRPYQVGKIWSIQYFENFVFICRLPKKINRDSSNRLHSTTEAAVQWNGYDYFGKRDLYFIHGVFFEKEEWTRIVKNEISSIDLLKMENKEKQRAALSVYSTEKLIKDLFAEVIDIYKNPRSGDEIILYVIDKEKVDLENDIHILKYKDPSTNRIYVSGVPENIFNANEAMAWKFGLTVEEYENELLQET